MRKILLFCLIMVLAFSTVGCATTNDNGSQAPSGYDYIVGNDYSDLVTITFKYANIEGKNGETYKTWAIKRGGQLGRQLEPQYPSSQYNYAYYGLRSNFCWVDGTTIDLGLYTFDSDTTIYCKYYGTGYSKMPTWRVHFGRSKNDWSWNESWSDTSYYNAQIRELPTPNNKFKIATDVDDTKRRINSGIIDYLVSLGYSNFTYYTTQDCTEKIALPFQNTIDEIWCIVSK